MARPLAAHGKREQAQRNAAHRAADGNEVTNVAPSAEEVLRLGVHPIEDMAAAADDPGAFSPVQGYAAHYCGLPSRVDPAVVAWRRLGARYDEALALPLLERHVPRQDSTNDADRLKDVAEKLDDWRFDQ